MDPFERYVEGGPPVACSQLYCSRCNTPVKHMDGVKDAAVQPHHLRQLYASLNPDDWMGLVQLSDEYRLYFCRCHWYATPGAKQVGHLDTANIDEWACAGHPVRS